MARSSLLQRAENLYLNILRVLILAVATLALLGAVLGLIGAVPLLKPAPKPGADPPATLEASTLGDFITEKKAEGQDVTEPSSATETTTVTSSVTVKQAAQNIQWYVKSKIGLTFPLDAAIKEINANESDIPADYRNSYEISLRSLTKQLTLSKGKALSGANLDALLQWHAAKFKAAAEAEAGKIAQEKIEAAQRLQLGGYALLTFLLLVFAFIFVKIERNLRVVRTLTTVDQ